MFLFALSLAVVFLAQEAKIANALNDPPLELPVLSPDECEGFSGIIVYDIGDGRTQAPDYLCESNNRPPIGSVQNLPGLPIFLEGAVCCYVENLPQFEELTREGCLSAPGMVVGDIGNGATRRSDYVCESNGEPIIGIIVPLPGEPIASEGEVCCGVEMPKKFTREGCLRAPGMVVGDIGNGATRRSDYVCESNGEPIIGIIVPLPGEPIAIEGEVCCGLEMPKKFTRDSCLSAPGIVVGDIGNGATRRSDYVCESSGEPIIGIIVPLPGEPIAIEGEVCCGLEMPKKFTRDGCLSAPGIVVGDIGNGATLRSDYVCESNGEPIIGIIVPLPGEPIALEGEVCCGFEMPKKFTRDGCLSAPGMVVGDIGNGATRRSDYLCESSGEPIIGIIAPLPGEPVAIEGEVCCGVEKPKMFTREGCLGAPGIVVGDIGNGATRRSDYVCESNGEPIIGIIVPLPGEPISIEGEVCCGLEMPKKFTREGCLSAPGIVVGDIGNGATRRSDYVCESTGEPIIGIIAPLPGEPIALEGEVCCGVEMPKKGRMPRNKQKRIRMPRNKQKRIRMPRNKQKRIRMPRNKQKRIRMPRKMGLG